jgi:DNA-binding transcriptional LysR family regulator
MFANLFQESGLSLERMHTFCLVADSGGVTRAAGGDPNTQSLFSRQIKELEEYFGVELVRRSGRGVVLTDAGKELAIVIREQLMALDDFKARCKKLPLKLTIAAGDSLMHWLLLPRLDRIKKRLPNVSFVFLNLKSAEIMKRLFEGTIDFGFVREGEFSLPVKCMPMGVLSHSLFVSQRLTSTLGLKEILAKFPFATLEGSGAFRKELANALKKEGARVGVQLECSSFPLIARALKTQKAVAVLPTIAESEFAPDLVTILKTPLLKRFDRRIVLGWNNRLSRIRPIVEKATTVLAEEMRFS